MGRWVQEACLLAPILRRGLRCGFVYTDRRLPREKFLFFCSVNVVFRFRVPHASAAPSLALLVVLDRLLTNGHLLLAACHGLAVVGLDHGDVLGWRDWASEMLLSLGRALSATATTTGSQRARSMETAA